MNPLPRQLTAFLTMIAVSEGTAFKGDDGYNVLVGGTLFEGYADHPRRLVDLGHGLQSTAAGRYQILERYFDAYKISLKLPDFGHASQDAIAVQMIREQKALPAVMSGNLALAVIDCANIWASLPGSNYGQHENAFSQLASAFVTAGGVLA